MFYLFVSVPNKFYQNLNLVMFGRSSAEKTFTANTILPGVIQSEPIHKCVKKEGVCYTSSSGYQITLVEMPELYDMSLSQKDVLREAYCALSLCSFNIQTFLLVLPVSPLTDEDKGEIKLFSGIFDTADGKFWDHLMIVFIWEGDRKDKIISDFIHGNRDIQQIVQKCGNRYHTLSIKQRLDSEQLSELLTVITRINTSYSCATYQEAQVEKRIQLEDRIKEMEEENRELKMIKQTGKTNRNTLIWKYLNSIYFLFSLPSLLTYDLHYSCCFMVLKGFSNVWFTDCFYKDFFSQYNQHIFMLYLN